MVGKSRLVDLRAAAAQDVDIPRLGFPDVIPVYRAVLMNEFAEAHLDGGATEALQAQPHPAADILSQVEDVNARLRAGERYRYHVIDNLDRRHHLC